MVEISSEKPKTSEIKRTSPEEKRRARRERLKEYRNGAEGFIQWAEDNVCLEIFPIVNGRTSTLKKWVPIKDFTYEKHPETGRSYREMWEAQQKIVREALKLDENGTFFYRLIVLCWMRGEGKSLLVCLILIWRYCCWPRLQIMLGANSKEQTKFVHYDIIRDIIRNSPKLRSIVGERNIQEKEIRLTNSRGEISSLIRSISTASGIVSNISNYSFSEIFDMKNPKFFVQLDGSIRNIPNAFGLIDSTVSDRDHILYQTYEGWRDSKLKRVFFSHRQSREAKAEDFWNPYMTQDQLDDYAAKFPTAEFDRYFKNSWDSGQQKPFTREVIEETNIIAYAGNHLDHLNTSRALQKKWQLLDSVDDIESVVNKKNTYTYENLLVEVKQIESKFEPVDSIYTLRNYFGPIPYAPVDVIHTLSDLFKTDFSIHAGLDMSDPMAMYAKARTILTFIAKGLPGSKYDMSWIGTQDKSLLKYVYFLIGIEFIEDASVDTVKEILVKANTEYEGLDSFCGERYGGGSLPKWLEDRKIKSEFISPSYNLQRDAFKELFLVTKEGRFKKPKVHIPGMKEEDIVVEEMGVFYQNVDKKWFGSPFKNEKYGVQDDSIYSIGWNIYGAREFGPEHFRSRKKSPEMFGIFYEDPNRRGIFRGRR